MNSLDILIDMSLLQEQYNFLIQKYQIETDEIEHHGFIMNQYDQDLWDGILGFFEAILEDTGTLDKARLFMLDSM